MTSFSGSILSPSDKLGKIQMTQHASSSRPSSIPGPSSSSQQKSEAPPHFDLFAHLIRYDKTLTLSDFKSSIQRCGICFDESLGSTFVILDCGEGGGGGGQGTHSYCKLCLTQHCMTLIQSGSIDMLRCPEPACRASIPPYILEAVLTPEAFEKYEHLALQKALAGMADLSWCPRCDGPTIVDNDGIVCQCPSCLYVFCFKCLGPYHPAERCLSELEQLEMKQLAEERRQNTKLSEEDRRRKRADLIHQHQSMQLVIPREVGYDHFGQGLCELFEQAEIDQWEQLNGAARGVREARMRNQAMVDVMRGDREGELQMRPVNCRMCGQLNVREGNNNLIRCWACRGKTCAVCREPLRAKPGLHFGNKEGQCRQHS